MKKLEPNVITDVEHDGKKFQVVIQNGLLRFGKKITEQKSQWGGVWFGDLWEWYVDADETSESDDSCAYGRLQVVTHNAQEAMCLQWAIANGYIKEPARACVCYVIPRDGKVQPLLKKLKFKQVASQQSKHGKYMVELWVHPGTNNKKKKTKNATKRATARKGALTRAA